MHTQLLPGGPARAGTADSVLTPCLACGLTLCPTSPLSSTGHRAASSSSSHDLWRIIHSLRGSLGRLLPPGALLASLPFCVTCHSPQHLARLHQKQLRGPLHHFALPLEAKRTTPRHPSPLARWCQPLSLLEGTKGKRTVLGTRFSLRVLSFQSLSCGCGAWFLRSIPEAPGASTGLSNSIL